MSGRVIVVGGATASGKTALAVALAEKYDGEVISADAFLVYRGLNIGTAKPTAAERRGIVHHMIDVAEPTCDFSVSDYERMALPVLKDVLARKKTAIVCGGTGFYMQALLFSRRLGGAAADAGIRKKYLHIAEEKGKTYLHSLLEACDAESAARLHENDVRRVVRALEIYELTGRKKSEQHDTFEPRFPYTAYAVDYPREELYARIDRRVEEMFAGGLVGEVEGLRSRGVDERCRCMQAIGYKEILQGLHAGESEGEMKEKIKQNTRNYAKRQLTFFRKFPALQWIEKDFLP